MTAEKFVKGFYLERQSLLDEYFNTDNKTEVSALIRSLTLDDEQTERLRQILSGALRDTLYTVLFLTLEKVQESLAGDKLNKL